MYILEGNIGAGKSTFLSRIQSYIPYIYGALEPVATWQHKIDGASLLELFITDPHRWAYMFEKMTMMTRIQEHRILQKKTDIVLVERSVYSGYYCFAKNSHHEGFMTSAEWAIYQQWFHLLVPQLCHQPQGFIYLRVNPALAYERMKKRDRQEEETIPISYLEQIHQRHDSFLLQKEAILPHLKSIPVLVLEINDDFESDDAYMQTLAGQVDAFIRDTMPTEIPSFYLQPSSYERVRL